MPKRIAIASTDGKVINEHFGHADHFYIVDIDENRYQLAETRVSRPSCTGETEHAPDRFAAVLDLLADCDEILVSRIGISALNYAASRGVKVTEAPGLIAEALKKYIG